RDEPFRHAVGPGSRHGAEGDTASAGTACAGTVRAATALCWKDPGAMSNDDGRLRGAAKADRSEVGEDHRREASLLLLKRNRWRPLHDREARGGRSRCRAQRLRCEDATRGGSVGTVLPHPRSRALQMLHESRHQLDQVAGPVTAVELPFENIVPAVAAGAGRAGQGEEVRAAGNAAGGPALDGRGLHLLVREHAEKFAEALDLLLRASPKGLQGAV